MTSCAAYEIFGDCSYGPKCNKSHSATRNAQDLFFFATLESNPIGLTSVKRMESSETEEFWVRRGEWFSGNAQKGHFVLFQASLSPREWPAGRAFPWAETTQKDHKKTERPQKKKNDRKPDGRVVLNLGTMKDNSENSSIWKEFCSCKTLRLLKVSTLDPQGTKRFDNAYNVERYSDGKCKKIGIHVTCPALANPLKIKTSNIRPENSTRQFSCPGFEIFNLRKDRVAVALSYYVHTNGREEENSLEFSLVKVQENCYFGPGKNYNTDFDGLWSHFVGKKSLLFQPSLQKCLFRYPYNWKEVCLLQEMMSRFRSAIRKLTGSARFITKIWSEENDQTFVGKITVPKELIERTNNGIDDARKLAAAGLGFIEAQKSDPFSLVKQCWSAEKNGEIVPCTSPMRNCIQFVNQQIILQHLRGFTDELYSEKELLGILGARHETPSLQFAVIRKLEPDIVRMQYRGLINTPDAIFEAPYSVFGRTNEASEITIKGISADQYCNQPIVHLDQKRFKEFLDECDDREAKIDFKKLKGAYLLEDESPYRSNGDETILTLKAGIELQIQISIEDAEKNRPLKWRMLRIAKNRHLCFTHLNNPELAFISKRQDVQMLVPPLRIKRLADVERSKLPTIFMYDISVKWDDSYYSGGSFDVEEDKKERMDKGSLLCIRKEISAPGDSGVKYIWCCHGVICAKNGRRMNFKVCTLSQTESLCDEKDGFSVEVINTELKDDRTRESQEFSGSSRIVSDFEEMALN